MRIDTRRSPKAICLLSFLLVVFLLGSCSGGPPADTPAGSPGNGQEEPVPGYVTAHFVRFEVPIPEGWAERGNVGKLYEGDGMFLLAGPLETEGDILPALEQTLSEELQLFFNTEYYASKTVFSYEEDRTDGMLRALRGTLRNGRTETELAFAGGVSTSPGGYFFYFWSDGDNEQEALRRAEISYEHFQIL